MASWNDVRRFALALPGTSEQTSSDGARSWVVNSKLFAWERPLRRSDIEALGKDAPTGAILSVRTAGLEMKEMLLARNPNIYFTTPHFDGYSAVLIRLGKISRRELSDVIFEAWAARAPNPISSRRSECGEVTFSLFGSFEGLYRNIASKGSVGEGLEAASEKALLP